MVTARCDGLAVMPRQPVGVLILRIWLEPDSPTPFRATIRMSADVGFGPLSACPFPSPARSSMRCEASLTRWLAGMTCRNERARGPVTRSSRPGHGYRGKVMPNRGVPLGGTNGVVIEGTSGGSRAEIYVYAAAS